MREGIQKRDELIGEGHAQAARIVQEAENEHSQVKQRLSAERQSIEGEIERLRDFEREYRASLKAFISQQVQGLDSPSLPTSRSEGA